MRATAVIPVKRFDAAKQRLGEGLAPAERRDLAGLMLNDVLDAIGRCAEVESILLVSGEPATRELARRRGLELIDDSGDHGQSAAAALGIARAIELGAECVALLPGDCPLLDPAEVDTLLDRIETPSVTIVPDRHGTGTNSLVLTPPDAIGPAFGEGSCERHVELARSAGVPHAVVPIPSLALDIDTPEDLALWRASS